MSESESIPFFRRTDETHQEGVNRRDAALAEFREHVSVLDPAADFLQEELLEEIATNPNFGAISVESFIASKRRIHASVVADTRQCHALRDGMPRRQ